MRGLSMSTCKAKKPISNKQDIFTNEGTKNIIEKNKNDYNLSDDLDGVSLYYISSKYTHFFVPHRRKRREMYTQEMK